MDIAESQLVVKMLALFKNRENADVSLVCEGKTILAHSTILELRWYSQGVWCCGVCILRIKWTFKSPLSKIVFGQVWVLQDSPEHCSRWREVNYRGGGVLFQSPVCNHWHSCLKGSKTKKNSPVLRLVPFFVKLPHESPQKIWKSGHEGFLRNLHFFFPL